MGNTDLMNQTSLSYLNGVFFKKKGSFNPKSIKDLSIWLDASDFNTITKDGSDLVSQWDDKSGNGNDAAQGTGTKQPVWTDAIINGKSVLRYDGTDDVLIVSSLTLNVQITLFVVGQFTNTGSNQLFIEHGPNTGNTDGFFFYGFSNPASVRRTSSVSITSDIGWLGANNVIGVFFVDGTNMFYQKNGTVLGSDPHSFSNTTATGDLHIGDRLAGGLATNGDYAEIILYNRTLNIAEKNKVLKYLSKKWGIGL